LRRDRTADWSAYSSNGGGPDRRLEVAARVDGLLPAGDSFLKANNRVRKAALLGLAFDAEDGQKRLSRGENFVLFGGSEESHAVMQETAVKINERLDQQGRRLEDVSVRELGEICRDIWSRGESE
jgi:hypothetical protein